MTQMTQPIGTWLLFAVWQSTLILGVAILLGRSFRKTPWQSHDLHLFGIVAAVLAPTFSTVIAVQNAGWLANGRFSDTFAPLLIRSNMLGVSLLIGMAMFLTLLAWGIVDSRKLMFRAKPFPDRESQEALLRSAETLQNVSLPILFTSPNVKSPTVWCWGLHPAVVLPEALADKLPAEERDAIFLHELAHITRRDHLTALLTRICGIFLFWQPLYWFALKQADLLADEACDLLVLSRGNVSPETYTETLLRLAAGERIRPAFQFLSRKEKIMKRISTILDFGELPNKPSVNRSRLWQCSALVVALLLSVTLAFCQEKKDAPVTFDGFAIYDVNKNIADFKKADLSSPEAAYATMNRVLAARDTETLAKFNLMTEQKLSDRDLQRHIEMGSEEWSEILKTAEILKVSIFKDQVAVVVAKLGGEETQKPYDLRWLRKIDGKWFNTGNDRCNSPDEALMKFARHAENDVKKVPKITDADATSLKGFLSKELLESKDLKWYPVKKYIADFPADEIDLSTPEASYATQKNLIVSNRKDKLEQLSNMTVGRPEISGRERRGIENEISEEWAKTYREEFVVFEVFILNDKHAFVFGLREFDSLYDGNYFMRQDDQWLNMGNDQSMEAHEIADRVEKTFARRAKVLQELSGKETTAPKIAKMEPANGAEDVDASAMTELRVTFDRDMNTDGYSWCGGGETYPETTGSPKWIDKRTCVLPVKLQPGKKYMLGINAKSFRNFKSADGVSVVPVVYTFETKTE